MRHTQTRNAVAKSAKQQQVNTCVHTGAQKAEEAEHASIRTYPQNGTQRLHNG